jgi:hypothetical protein
MKGFQLSGGLLSITLFSEEVLQSKSTMTLANNSRRKKVYNKATHSSMIFNIVDDMNVLRPMVKLKRWFQILLMAYFPFFNVLIIRLYLWNMTLRK